MDTATQGEISGSILVTGDKEFPIENGNEKDTFDRS